MEWLNHDLIKDMEKGRGLGGQEGSPTTGEIRGTHVYVSGPVLLIPERKSWAAVGAVFPLVETDVLESIPAR